MIPGAPPLYNPTTCTWSANYLFACIEKGQTDDGATDGEPAIARRDGHTAESEQVEVALELLTMTGSIDFPPHDLYGLVEGEQVRDCLGFDVADPLHVIRDLVNEGSDVPKRKHILDVRIVTLHSGRTDTKHTLALVNIIR